MGLKKISVLECDRCHNSIEVEENAIPFDVTHYHEGWLRVSGDRFLCPKCSEGYELLEARHRVELEDYIKGDS